MKFTNISARGVYLQSCHREVEPGGSFDAPWARVRKDRGTRAAMSSGVLAWSSGDGEPEIPGSPALPDPKRAEEREAAMARRKAEADAAVARKMAEDEAGVKANMAAMGNFNVPQLREHYRKVEARRIERPVTREDIIADKPKSLADVSRHNRAVRKFSERKGN